KNRKVLPLEGSFSKPLYKNSNLLRIVLHRRIENRIQLREWYRIDLKLVTEMGLLMDLHPHLIKLTCTILVNNKRSLTNHQIQSRPISEDAWDPDAAKSEGFLPFKSIGGIEYRVNTLPSSLSKSTYFLLREQWHFGTPGKIWDSAIVMTDILLKIFATDPTHLANKRVLDLSAGTGYIGLSIAQCYQECEQPPHIILTDLEEALGLIEENQVLNGIQDSSRLSIKTLSWGNKEEAADITKDGALDVIIASDVLYNVEHFSKLISTFRDLCDASTIIYLCYKQRGLTVQEENSFFGQCKKYFMISQL
ncbi:putative methyltransferase-domain-containing protein, partial [Mucor mucedo]|uniref:putative methyltransferase-domain-containing protein n=1 Tax=Mucor mucedo TaxID=29922 RepID=UPI00221E608E